MGNTIMIFYKLKPEKTIIGWNTGNPASSSLAGISTTLVDEFGTVLTYPADNPPTYSEFPGLETVSLKYVSFSLNDSGTSRQIKTIRISLGYGDALGNSASVPFLIPANKPIRIHIPLTVINSAIVSGGMTYESVTKKFLDAVNPNQGSLADVMTVYSYQQY
jgi:hypothetical protein